MMSDGDLSPMVVMGSLNLRSPGDGEFEFE